MAYIVVKHFTDLQDKGYKYNEGDIYPREGYVPSDERIEMLSTANNRQKTVLIEAVPEPPTEDFDEEWIAEHPPDEEPVSEDGTLSKKETVEEKPKRKSRKKAE